ncbi:hypothetical protein ACO1O0_006847 [Amphichorda felina]
MTSSLGSLERNTGTNITVWRSRPAEERESDFSRHLSQYMQIAMAAKLEEVRWDRRLKRLLELDPAGLDRLRTGHAWSWEEDQVLAQLRCTHRGHSTDEVAMMLMRSRDELVVRWGAFPELLDARRAYDGWWARCEEARRAAIQGMMGAMVDGARVVVREEEASGALFMDIFQREAREG